MNPSPHRIKVYLSTRRLSPSVGTGNKVTLAFRAVTEDIHEDPATGIRTLIGSSPVPFDSSVVNFSNNSTCHSHIGYLLYGRIIYHLSSSEISATHIRMTALVCERVASRVASETSNLGFGYETNLSAWTFVTPRVIIRNGQSPVSENPNTHFSSTERPNISSGNSACAPPVISTREITQTISAVTIQNRYAALQNEED